MNWLIDKARRITPRVGGAALHGVVLFTSEHANIRKVLDDKEMWQALDEVSGPRWAVFALTAAKGHWGFPDYRPGTMDMMIPVWKEPAANRDILETFAISDTRSLPSLGVFACAEDGSVRTTTTPLSDESLDEAYRSLKAALMEVRVAVEKVSPEVLGVPERAFAGVEYQLRNANEWKLVKEGLRWWKGAVSVLPW